MREYSLEPFMQRRRRYAVRCPQSLNVLFTPKTTAAPERVKSVTSAVTRLVC